jgi:CCR4-NOT transcription complex subunit 3
MKKVDEGVELFDDIWEKVYSAEQQNQKEKYEVDLKKEIKKLQRHRDQIKSWIGSSDVKDKDALMEARRLIETKMEQFKICEKETKTKTYSKEGLAREDKLDPSEESKLNTTSWLQEYIEQLQGLVEETDFEIERLSTGKGKKQNKHQIEKLKEHITNHRNHISKIEGIIRLVNNDRLEVEPVDALRDDLDYYLESYEDEDYHSAYDEDYFYESLGLDELDVVNVDTITAAATSSKKTDGDDPSMNSKGSDNKKGKAAVSSVIPLTIGRARSSSAKVEKVEEAKVTPVKKSPAPAPVPVKSPVAVSPVPPAQGASMAAILKRETEQQEMERQKVSFVIGKAISFDKA